MSNVEQIHLYTWYWNLVYLKEIDCIFCLRLTKIHIAFLIDEYDFQQLINKLTNLKKNL